MEVVTYRGNYTAYLKQRQERWERHQQIFEEEKGRLEAEMDYIRLNISNRNPELAQGKLKRVTRDLVAIEQFGLNASAFALAVARHGAGAVLQGSSTWLHPCATHFRSVDFVSSLSYYLKAPMSFRQLTLFI